ncbi:Protein of unknown function [Lactobacillus equicursoris 66c]|uniref:Uncharacterized protein n=1 Tax=Lactobacillus equicursoris 66c TaxID=872326 RepID=K0NVQ5_9LACO|nr:Protein of unknown function [Lactobacillus equicursoris 66c]
MVDGRMNMKVRRRAMYKALRLYYFLADIVQYWRLL